jgi:hypothetical protein
MLWDCSASGDYQGAQHLSMAELRTLVLEGGSSSQNQSIFLSLFELGT